MTARPMHDENTGLMSTMLKTFRLGAIAAIGGALLLCALPSAHAQSGGSSISGSARTSKKPGPIQFILPKPTLTVTYSPAQPVAGQNFTTTWTTQSANSVSYNCFASGTGYAGSGDMGTGSGSMVLTAQAGWVGNPSSCDWTADNGAEFITVTKTLTTVAGTPPPPAPTISVSRSRGAAS